MSKPDFFLVGAPKCGTTALSEYLRAHRQVFMSTPKEPHYFATDLPGLRYTRSIREYEGLFAKAGPWHRAVGEASPGYMFSTEAVQNIRAYNPAARLIVTLRNPVDMLPSYHAQLLYSLYEDQADMEEAWRLQEARRSGSSLPAHCREPAVLQYREVLRLGDQLQRVLSLFPPEQVHIIFYDDFCARPAEVFRAVLSFLGIADDERSDFPVVNPKKTARWRWMNVLLHDPPAWMLSIMRSLAGTALHAKLVALHAMLKSLNTRPLDGRRPSAKFRTELLDVFLPEIALIERLTGRNLDAWKQ